jgi:hypothetical protein
LEESKVMPWDAYIVNDELNAAYVRLRAEVEGPREQCRLAREAAK